MEKIKEIDMSSTILIDNSPFSYMHQPNNAIPIFPFVDEMHDNQLIKLEEFLLDHILKRNSKDIRSVLQRYFKLEEYGKFNNVKDLVDCLYF